MAVKVREKIKGSGEWWVFIYHGNRRVTKRVGSKKAASRVAKIIEGNLAAGQLLLPKTPKPHPTLAEYFAQFKGSYLRAAVRQSTQDMYNTSFNRILPILGHRHLDQITRPTAKALIATLVERGLSKTTITITMSRLCCLFNHAIEDGLITENPTRNTSRYYRQAPVIRDEIQPLSHDEVKLFLQIALEHSPKYYPLFLCAVHTGMRSGELTALQWDDIDFDRKFLFVRRSFYRGTLSPTKTSKIRRIDLSTTLLKTLLQLRQERHEEWLKKGHDEIPSWVFCNRTGKPPDLENAKNRHFFPCLEKAGLRRIRFHDLRHTFATLLIQNGEPLAYVRDQLGHSSIKMTVDTYTHWIPGSNREAMDRLPSLEEIRPQSGPRGDTGTFHLSRVNL